MNIKKYASNTEYIYDKYNTLKWYEKYNLIEFLINFFYDVGFYYELMDLAPFGYEDSNQAIAEFRFYEDVLKERSRILVQKLNKILEEENTAYRVIDYKITLITDKLELEAVSNASTNDGGKFKIATSHINDAIDALSKKPAGDYNKVITSSVLAIEVALKESLDITGNDKISNKLLIARFQEKYKVNKFITEPINQFIGILRNAEYDTLHSSPDNKNSSKETPFKATFMEAKYVLVTSCNFLNYIKLY